MTRRTSRPSSRFSFEDEGRVVPLLVAGDRIEAWFENGAVHRIRVDFSQTKTHPNYPPSTSYSKLKALAVKEFRLLSRLARSGKAISRATDGDISIACNTTSLSRNVESDPELGNEYRIYADGTMAGRRLPPLSNARAYRLAYVAIPPPNLVYAHPKAQSAKTSRTSHSGYTSATKNISEASPEQASAGPAAHFHLEQNNQHRGRHTSRARDAFRSPRAETTHSTAALFSVFSPIRRKRTHDETELPRQPAKSLVVRISRAKLRAAGATPLRFDDGNGQSQSTELGEFAVRWSTMYMYPLTQRYETMYNCDAFGDQSSCSISIVPQAGYLSTGEVSSSFGTWPSGPIAAGNDNRENGWSPVETEITILAVLAALDAA